MGQEPAPEQPKAEPSPLKLELGGYVEAFWQWNAAKPENGITNYRGFDNRHNSFTLSNVALDTRFSVYRVVGRVTAQVGHTPSTYYLAEPLSPGTPGANESNSELWKYLQRAHAGYRGPLGDLEVTVEGGLFLSPIGVENMAVYENWNWSRSNLFFGLPFYHTGARVQLSSQDKWATTLAVFNGWNSVVDNNGEKSLCVQGDYTLSPRAEVGLLYFGGVERPRGAPEGDPWRHLFDAHFNWQPIERLSLMGEANGGFERNRFGTSAWGAGALYARVALVEGLAVAVRGDVVYEHVPRNARGQASPVLFPSTWVSSATATLDYAPLAHLALRLEYRHDHADDPMFFRGAVSALGEPDSYKQDTVTVGATAWF